MQTEVGIFTSRTIAEQTIRDLHANGVPQSSLIFLSGDRADLEHIPTTDTEPDGMGTAMGALLGGAAGAGAGMGIGTAASSLLVPGIGPILAAGIGAAAILGLGGATVGASLGGSSEAALDQGTPRDDISLYHDLLRDRKSLVIVNAESEERARLARDILIQQGAQSIDEARNEMKARGGKKLRRAS